MTNLVSALQPAIDALELDLADLERRGNALLVSINVLREKAGLPPRPGSFSPSEGASSTAPPGSATNTVIHSDTFLGKKLGAATRQYLEMRKASGGDAPATPREIFDALKSGGFAFGAKDETTALTVLRALLRKRTDAFHRLDNGRYGLRSWYGDLPRRRPSQGGAETPDAQPEAGDNPATGASVPFMITQEQKTQLRQRGLTDEQIREMKPEEAHRVLGLTAASNEETAAA